MDRQISDFRNQNVIVTCIDMLWIFRAVDSSGFTGTATLTIRITNVNDENPVFTSSSGDITLAESTAVGKKYIL
jgi:hypothetical protein